MASGKKEGGRDKRREAEGKKNTHTRSGRGRCEKETARGQGKQQQPPPKKSVTQETRSERVSE